MFTRNRNVHKVCFYSMVDSFCGRYTGFALSSFIVRMDSKEEKKDCFNFLNENFSEYHCTSCYNRYTDTQWIVITNFTFWGDNNRSENWLFHNIHIFNNIQTGFRLRVPLFRELKLYRCRHSGWNSKSNFCHFDKNLFVQFQLTNGLSLKLEQN